jgi:hypothetical protein
VGGLDACVDVEQFAEIIKTESVKWRDVVRQAHIEATQ